MNLHRGCGREALEVGEKEKGMRSLRAWSPECLGSLGVEGVEKTRLEIADFVRF